MAPLCCTAYRRCVTGITEYQFFRDSEAIGSASAMVLPSYPVVIHAGDLTLHCERDLAQTIVPSCQNTVFYKDQVYAAIVQLAYGTYALRIGQSCFHVIFRDGIWHFFRNRIPAATLKSCTDASPLPGDWEPRLELTVAQPVPREQLVLLLCFPLLQPGI